VKFRVGTRGSPLALAQASWARERWERAGLEVDVVVVETRGDQVRDRRLHEIGAQGLFTKEIEDALRSGTIDAAVHSLKDVPSRLPDGCRLGAITAREDARDVLVTAPGGDPDALGAGSRIGTSSLRREAIWRMAHPDHEVVGVRGNLDTRLSKLGQEVDALIVAAAGLHRMRQQHRVSRYLDPGWMVPSPGQGALGIEVREGDDRSLEAARMVADAEAEAACTAERAVMLAAGGSCQIPLGVYAAHDAELWNLYVFFDPPAGKTISLGWRGADLDVGVAWAVQEVSGRGGEAQG
jgi:hydroxymethylbilane synthase